MSLLCFVGKHTGCPSEIWNQGLYFSSCRRCGCDMVRADTVWEPVPHGFRIVWRPAKGPEQAGPTDAIRNLPMVILQGPVIPPPARVTVRNGTARRPLGLMHLVFLGFELLALYGADGFTKWRRSVTSRHLQRHAPVLLLAR
jgi:hypothetical protein